METRGAAILPFPDYERGARQARLYTSQLVYVTAKALVSISESRVQSIHIGDELHGCPITFCPFHYTQKYG